MRKRDEDIVFEYLSHFLIDGWRLILTEDYAVKHGVLTKSDLTKQGQARLARLMPYLSLRSEGGNLYLEKNFKKESEIPAEHLLVYYKRIATERTQEADKLYDIIYNTAEQAGVL